MGALSFIFLLIGVGVISAIIIKHGGKSGRVITVPLLIICIIGAALAIGSWHDAAGKTNLKYHYVSTIPFEFNPSDRDYYIYHEDEFKKADKWVEGFSTHHLKEPAYDSCHVYRVETPTFFLGFLNNEEWHPKFEYRQSQDILLQHREVEKVKINEGKD